MAQTLGRDSSNFCEKHANKKWRGDKVLAKGLLNDSQVGVDKARRSFRLIFHMIFTAQLRGPIYRRVMGVATFNGQLN